MFSLTAIINLSLRQRKTFFMFLAMNLLLSLIVLLSLPKNSFYTEYEVVFNKVSKTFSNEGLKDFVFEDDRYSDFISVLKSDTVCIQTVDEFHLVNRFKVAGKDRKRRAVNRLRSSIVVVTNEPTLKVRIKGNDKQLTDSLVSYMIKQVDRVFATRVENNNLVSKKALIAEYAYVSRKIDSAQNSVQLFEKENTELRSVDNFLEVYSSIHRELLLRKDALEHELEKLNRISTASKYQAFYTNFNGTVSDSYHPLSLLFLFILANIIALILELQTTLIINALKKKL